MKPAPLKYLSLFSALFLLLMLAGSFKGFCQKKYSVIYQMSSKDTSNKIEIVELKSEFDSKENAQKYFQQIPQKLMAAGFAAASVDSVFYDSLAARVVLYFGKRYQWAQIATDSIDPAALSATGWSQSAFNKTNLNFAQLKRSQEKLLDYYQNNGYPFAKISLQQVQIIDQKLYGHLLVNRGPLYHIDSIQVLGKARLNKFFLQQYLGLPDGSVYDHSKLQQIDKKIEQLGFVKAIQPSDLTMLGTGATVVLYLNPKPNNEVNVLVGYEPANTVVTKARLTADVHLNLRNSFGHGESILFNWQQLQAQSPKLNLGFSTPYVLRSRFGIDASFSLLKKDSSYLQLDEIIGLQYLLSPDKTFKIFYEGLQNYLLQGGIDTNAIILTKKLPPNIDVTSSNIGVAWHVHNTNYTFNPRRGNELDVSATAGIRKTTESNDITNLNDPANPGFDFKTLYDSIRPKSYRFKFAFSGAHYFPVGKNAAIKTAGNAGLLESPQSFQNELFRIGGYQFLRGFDEESIYASQYLVLTAEYRYLVATNSYFFGFSDLGFTRTKFNDTDYSNRFLSGGLGLQFETKFGLLNLAYAVGKRNDLKFDLRNSSRIHFGYINYF